MVCYWAERAPGSGEAHTCHISLLHGASCISLGHYKLSEVRPQHLNAFYQELEKAGARKKDDMALPKVNFRSLLISRGMTQGAFARASHVSHTMVERLCHGEHISLKRAEYIADFLGEKTRDLFKIERDSGGLSQGTIRRFHGFLSIVFAQAEKEMLIPYNPAKRASPPGREEPIQITFSQSK